MVDSWVEKDKIFAAVWDRVGAREMTLRLPNTIALILTMKPFWNSLYLDDHALVMPTLLQTAIGQFRSSTVGIQRQDEDGFVPFPQYVRDTNAANVAVTRYSANILDIQAARETGCMGYFRMPDSRIQVPTILYETGSVPEPSSQGIVSTLNTIGDSRIIRAPVSWIWEEQSLRSDLLNSFMAPFISPSAFPFGFIVSAPPTILTSDDLKDIRSARMFFRGKIVGNVDDPTVNLLRGANVEHFAYNSGILYKVFINIPNELNIIDLEGFIYDPDTKRGGDAEQIPELVPNVDEPDDEEGSAS
jgi:hypothetical protein